jgi:hypothetical protein
MVISLVSFYLTLNCNYSCPHCFTKSGPSVNASIDLNILKNYVDQLPPNKVEAITLVGGEPTLYPDFFEFLDYANTTRSKKGYPRTIDMISNGSWFTSPEDAYKFLKRMKTSGLDNVIVSTDKYHRLFWPRGLNLEAELTAIESHDDIPALSFHHANDVVPVGRAAYKVPKEELGPNLGCDLDEWKLTGDLKNLYIFPDGIYLCCLEAIKMGELGEDLEAIAHRIENDALLHAFADDMQKAIELVSERTGVNFEDVDEGHKCATCKHIFGDEGLVKALYDNYGTFEGFVRETEEQLIQLRAEDEQLLRALEEGQPAALEQLPDAITFLKGVLSTEKK